MIKALLGVLIAVCGSSSIAAPLQGAGPVRVPIPQGTSLEVASVPAPAGGVGGFVAASKMNQGRYGQSATLLEDGRVLIVEGGTFNGQELHTGEVYDPVRDRFTETGHTFFNRTYIRDGAVRLADGRVLIVGGCGNAVYNSSVSFSGFFCIGLRGAELYDPSTNAFSLISPMLDKRVWHTATPLQDGRILIAGGSTADFADLRYVTMAEVFDPDTERFIPAGSLAIGRISATATLLEDGKVLIAGGQGENGNLNEAELFDPATGQFSTTGSMISERMAHSATLLPDGRVLMVGGNQATLGAEIYDPASGTFSAAPSQPVIPVRYYHSAVRLMDGRVLILGGVVNAVYEPVAEIYDPSTGVFQAAGNLLNAVQFETATLLQDGRVLKAGGEFIDTQFELPTLTELYIPN